jgi:hypothetical protein
MRNRRIHALAAIALIAFAAPAIGQDPAPPLDLRLPESPVSPDPPDDASTPGDFGTGAGATTVHGSFTSGVGYSKGFGNSTFNAADLDVSATTAAGGVVDMHIGVQHSTGMPYAAPPDFVGRYPVR